MPVRAAHGMTLTELVVAAGAFVALVGGTGYVFTQTAAAVRATTGTAANNAAARAVAAQLREDLAAYDPEGFLVLAAPRAGPLPPGVNPTTLLAFTLCGRADSRFVTDGGAPVASNAALVVYAAARDASDPAGEARILCRYVYALTGRAADPANLRELIDRAAGDDPSPLDDLDVLGDSTAAIAAKAVRISQGSSAGSIEGDYVRPLLDALPTVNTAPRTVDDPVDGGVRQLWPYLCGAFDGMTVAFHDGLAADGTTPLTADEPTAWFTPNTTDPEVNELPRIAGGTGGAYHSWRRTYHGRYWACTSRRTNNFQPLALKITLRFRHNDVPSAPVEVIVPLRR
ncbi:MAG: hypothetical protein ACOC95_02710 [Planctomycetota bacterium]